MSGHWKEEGMRSGSGGMSLTAGGAWGAPEVCWERSRPPWRWRSDPIGEWVLCLLRALEGRGACEWGAGPGVLVSGGGEQWWQRGIAGPPVESPERARRTGQTSREGHVGRSECLPVGAVFWRLMVL